MSDNNPFALENIQQADPQQQPADDGNPFAMGAIQADQRQDQRARMFTAVRANPDQAAEADRLAKRYPAPADVLLRNLSDVKLQAAVDHADERLRASPKLAGYMRDNPFAAKMAHDDLDPLAQIEQFLSKTGRAAQAGAFNASGGAAGMFRGFADLAATGSEANPFLKWLEESGRFGGNPLRRLAEGFGQIAGDNAATAKALAPKADGIIEAGYFSGVQSLVQNLLTLPMAFAPGGQPAALTGMVSMTGGQAYQEARDQGLPMQTAIPFAVSQAAIEYATEKIPLGRLIGDVKAGAPAFQTVLQQIAAEVPGEQAATILQDLNEWAALNPDRPFVDYLAERPSAAAQTLIATLVGAGGNVAVAKAIDATAARVLGAQRDGDMAGQDADRLKQLLALAAQSKLRERSPETFAAAVQAMADEPGGAPAELRFDARTLAGEGGVLNQDELAQLPGVAEQMAEALATGGEVTVKLGDLAALAGTPLEQKLMEHARIGDNELSQSEAKAASAQAETFLKQEAQRIIDQSQDAQAAQQGADTVRSMVLDQLATAGRFTADVNGAYASLISSAYTVQAARMGMTADALFERFPLRVVGESVQGGVFNQADAAGLDDLRRQWTEAGIGHSISQKDGIITLSRIVVPDGERGTGKGTAAMQALVEYADKTGQHIALSPSGDFGGSKRRLIEFYKRFGFVQNKGRDRAFTTSESMYRLAPGGVLEQSARATFNPGTNTIALLKGADLSSFVHEAGHFFLEMQTHLAEGVLAQIDAGASVTDGERALVDDVNKLLAWFGVTGSEGRSALTEWRMMTLDEQRPYHEQFARGFEAYAFEGRAPSLELQGLFSRFRAWLVSVYRELKALNVELTDDVRGVFDRMLAADDAIKQMEAVRGFEPLFRSAAQAGMTPEQWAAYQVQGQTATDDAVTELAARSLRDMKWLTGARSRALKEMQRKASGLRKEVRIEVRAEIMAQPVYRAWAALTGKDATATVTAGKPKGTKELDPERDSLLVAVAKLGGLDREAARKDLGVHQDYHKTESGVFGKPVFRKSGGLSADYMAEALAEAGYLSFDENGQHSLSELEDKLAQELNGQPQYSYRHDYGGRGSADGAPLPDGVWFGKLDTAALRDMYGAGPDAIWRKLAGLRMTSEASGIAPDMVADTFGFSSADELVKALADAQPPNVAIEALTDQRMLERHGDLADERGIQRAADEAVHNEARGRFVATEFAALADGMGQREDTGRTNAKGQKITVNTMVRAAQQFAKNVVGGRKVRDLKPGQASLAESRAAQLAMRLLSKGDTAGATVAKRDELLNHYVSRETSAAVAEVEKAVTYLKRFDSADVRKKLPTEYLDQIDKLLERVDLRQTSNRELKRRASLADWIKSQEELGIEPDIPEHLREESQLTSFRDMTVDEFRGLMATVRQIDHLARLKGKLLTARDQREFDAIAQEIAASIVDNGGPARPVELEGEKGAVPWLEGIAALHRKLSSLFRQMDGGNDTGPLFAFIGRGMNERGTQEDVMIERATAALSALYAPIRAMKGGITGSRSKVYIPEIGASLTRGGRLAVALNWGNEDNRSRIMLGDKWSEGQVQAILKTLTPTELEFVNGVWEYLDSYWPEIAAKEKRLTGSEPEKVEAVPFTVTASDGTEVKMRGGYYPIKFDTDRSDRAEKQEAMQAAKEMMQGAVTRATTRRGHTKERAKEVKRAVRKDLNVITQHITQVAHDLAWHEWLIDTNRLLNDGAIVDAIRQHYGPKVLKTIRDGVMGIAGGDVRPGTDIDRALLAVRSNVTRATMGASLTTAFLQPFGLTQSMYRIGSRHVLRGAVRWAGDAARLESSVSWIQERSDFMRLRAKTFNRELREIRGTVAGKSKAAQVIDGGLFWMMQKMQLVADVPTWIGQYEKSLAEGLDEGAAVAQADRAVIEAQGNGSTKDLAEVQRKHPMLTQFYSYFNVTLNLTAEATAATDFKNPRAVAGWLGDMSLLLVIPAILPALLMYGLKGGGGDDEPEDWAKRVAKWQIGYLMGMVVGLREGSGMLDGFDYAGPPVARLLVDAGKVVKQTAQGEVDDPLVLAYVNLLGTTFGIPVTQAVRSYKGWQAWANGEDGAGAQSILFGPPPKN